MSWWTGRARPASRHRAADPGKVHPAGETARGRECSAAHPPAARLSGAVYPFTEWPTYAKSVKALAQFCGFAWRDANPSGAASIQWFNEYCRERDPDKLQRILDYNEDDCRAMAVLKSYLEELQAQGAGG